MSQRILVVEDQLDNRQILRDLLTSANFEVIEAVDGEAGLTAAAAHRPDLILMDIQLPGIDGYEATRRLKADAALHAIPVIAITAYELNEAEDKARAAGCDAYSPSVRVSCWRRFESICPRPRRRGDRMSYTPPLRADPGG
jgi:two-component system, cell cycle response regulator DivK